MADILFNKNDYKILEALIERQCNTPVASLTIKQLVNITQMSLSKVRSVKDNFILMEFIKEGSKDGNNKTYFITEKGLKHFQSAFGFDNDRIDEIIQDFENNYDENKGE